MERKIEILHTAPLITGGITSFVINISSKINHERYIISNVCFRDKKEISEDALINNGGKKYVVDIDNIKFKPYKIIKKFIGIYKIIKKNKIDVFHIDTDSRDQLFLALAAKLAGVKKVIYHSHNTKSGRNTFFRKFIEFISTPLLYIVVDEFMACSEKAGEFLFNNRIINSPNYHVVNNGIIVSNYIYDVKKRNDIRKKLGLDDKFIVGHVGRFCEQKNHEFLIDVFNEIKRKKENSILLLIGIGELQEKIKDKVNKIGLENSVIFLNARNDVNELLQAMDIFIFPSLYEGLPVVGIEIQAAGLPSVLSDTITDEVKITDYIDFLSLNNTSKVWADRAIEFSKVKRTDTSSELKKAGYDIDYTVKMLEKIYKGE